MRTPTPTLTPAERDAIAEAADTLDALWELDAARSMRNGIYGMEYEHNSPAPILPALLAREPAG